MKSSEELTHKQAVGILIQAVEIAQSKGAFTLDDAELVAKAVRVFVPNVETPKVETPKVETPKVETPKVETPKVETPNSVEA